MHIKLKLINICNCIQNCKFSLSDAHTISYNARFHSSTSIHFRTFAFYTWTHALVSLSTVRRQRCIIWKRAPTVSNSVAINKSEILFCSFIERRQCLIVTLSTY